LDQTGCVFFDCVGSRFCLSDGWCALHLIAQTGDPVFPFFQDLFGTRLLRSMDSVTGMVRGRFFTLPFKPTAKL